MTDELTPAQRARAAGYMPLATDATGNTFLSKDSQRVLTAQEIAAELDEAERREREEGK